MKTAWREACQAPTKTLGPALQALFQRAFTVAKQVRSHTEIGTHPISLASLSARLVTQVFESWSDLQVLFVGAGDMVTLACAHFAPHAPAQLAISNRSATKAHALLERFHLNFIPLADMPTQLHRFDVVVTGTASTLPLIGLGAVQQALKTRRHRPMLMIDLGVPRDIEAEVKQLSDVYLYTVDDLGRISRENQDQRLAGAQEAQVLVDEAAKTFWRAQQVRWQTQAALQCWQNHHHALQKTQVQWALQQLMQGQPTPEVLTEVLSQMAQRLSQQIQHPLLTALRSPDEAQRELAFRALDAFFLP
jgi:glutamyl-tRNA reductase